MDEKYARHERKESNVSMVESNRVGYCSVCGKEVSTYDGDILESNGSDVLCNECLMKMNELNKK
jgi:DNA-directed RNA polymerase subunit RPC12/RpoP